MMQALVPLVDFITKRSSAGAFAAGLIFALLLTPGFMYLLAWAEGKRKFRTCDEFRAFMPGDLYLGVSFSFGCSLFAQARIMGHSAPGWWHWVSTAVGCLAAVGLTVPEIIGAFYYRDGDAGRYHWRQMISPRKIWHNVVVYGVYGYLLMAICVPGFVLAPSAVSDFSMGRPFGGISSVGFDALRLLLLVELSEWILSLVYDVSHPKCATAHTKVNFRQWATGMAMIVFALVGAWAVIY